MSTKNTGGPAYPGLKKEYADPFGTGELREVLTSYGGMTLRDYFAAKAMQSLLMDLNGENRMTQPYGFAPNDVLAAAAYSIADAMLKAREQ